ncbi:glutaredoxin family protein [Quadrisphaera setariae]|uniref:Glutaredoxin family protein n=1 Tax=Quadrisphaera setariae TaxID=2593304 RepID=A0A5C8ZLN0_9ACTN|nr:glutaredoxin family protein [Quadrisphaera setariae]TXR57710.1 glutaredoxin family protein [Quadrisphaera setariae]
MEQGLGGRADERVVLYGRRGCHLCDVAREQVARACAVAGATWREVDVDDDAELVARYSDLVPVVTVDGRHHAHWRVSEEELLAALVPR